MLSKEELLEVKGGAGITASLINAFSRLVNTVLELGRSVGTAIVRAKNKSYCKVS